MCVKAIVIGNEQEEKELHLKLLALMFCDVSERRPKRVKYGKLARELGVSEEVIRYNVRKLLRLGYIRSLGEDVGYELTEKIILLGEKANTHEGKYGK